MTEAETWPVPMDSCRNARFEMTRESSIPAPRAEPTLAAGKASGSLSAIATGALAALVLAAQATAEPRIPKSDSEVLGKVPPHSVARQAMVLGTAVAEVSSPKETALAVRQLIDQSRTESNPRWLGRAQAILNQQPQAQPLPTELRLLRGIIRQSLHDFPGALEDLQAVLREDPVNAEAWLNLSSVHLVRGNFDEARQAALHFAPLSGKLAAAVAACAIGSVNGQLTECYHHLEKALTDPGPAPPAVRAWALTLMAEMATRLGKPDAAEKWFLSALAVNPTDSYLVGAYADFLLEEKRLQEADNFLAKQRDSDSVLLRRTITATRLDARSEPSRQLRNRMEARFLASRNRGELIHHREEARFALEVAGAPERALELAVENWAIQKEPADIKILLESAMAAGNTHVQKQAREWITSTGYKDTPLENRLRQSTGP